MAAVTIGSMKWPQQRAVLVGRMVKRAASMGCRDATVMRAVRLLDLCRADKLIDTSNTKQVADACLAACVKRLQPHVLMDDMPDDPPHIQAQVVCRAAADSSVCGIECLEKLFTAAGMDTHGRLFSFAKYLMFLSMCDIDLAGRDVPLLAATAVYITRKNHQKQIAGGIWSAALVTQSSVSESRLESSMTTLRMQRLMWGDTQTTKGIVTDAVDELFASPDRHGVASSRSHTQQEQQQQQQVSVWWLVLVWLWLWRLCCQVWSWCCGRPSADEQHALAHLFAEDRCRTPDISTTLALRAAARDIRDAFSSDQLRSRLDHSLSRDGDGINTPQLQLLRFDPSLGMGDLLAAVWIAEEGGRWDETGEVLQLASQCGDCTLPINLTADDIRTHANKTLMVVGRHVRFSDGSRLQLFQHGNGEVRAIKDEPGFKVTVIPPLPADHLSQQRRQRLPDALQLYQQHRLEHDPPVQSRINYHWPGQWVSSGPPTFDASVSSFAKNKILDHFYFDETHHQTNHTETLNRRVCGGRLDGLLTQSPHTPVAGCTTTFSGGRTRFLVLTDSSDDFVAWITIPIEGNNSVSVEVETTEAPAADVSENAPFKDRFPLTTRLARVALGRVAPYVFDGQIPTAMAAVGMIWMTIATKRVAEVRMHQPRRTAKTAAVTAMHRPNSTHTETDLNTHWRVAERCLSPSLSVARSSAQIRSAADVVSTEWTA
ncbi:unnamed protein product [Vitrella brassicaformis CCMP3155]|uniref:Cyclin C-terminal domain-containing protein n=1 Tax=Vitrella brassicaformis (strain CCMP3155) TaxID=1169540 RepID=A0A0G4F2P4_VITBC|nr:unnamed protein product [Vitrella brassicaformis CCMP3155]|eukprot:CEM05657.1 unnamed protein product [Vitrella brassicaformis CCMP3155]